jgi:hypothetical protein
MIFLSKLKVNYLGLFCSSNINVKSCSSKEYAKCIACCANLLNIQKCIFHFIIHLDVLACSLLHLFDINCTFHVTYLPI